MKKTVLDLGFVDFIDFMGGDLQVVNSARISYSKRHLKIKYNDKGLINFLAKHRHGTPFESSVFTFHVKAPLVVIREWMRHRICSYNEVSGRYVELPKEFYVPEGEQIREQVGKPGHYTFEPMKEKDKADAVSGIMEACMKHSFERYEYLLHIGVAKEVARMVLPLSLYSEFYWTINARSLMNFLSLRNSDRAMHEIREYAIALEHFFEKAMPLTYEAFVNNGRVAP